MLAWRPLALLRSQPETVSHTHGSLTYSLDWHWGKAQAVGDDGWWVTTDLGYGVQVTRAELMNASVALVPCQTSAAWLAPRAAKAGHGDPGDVSRWVGPRQEHVLSPTLSTLGTVSLGAGRYCAVHYLVAGSGGTPTLLLEGNLSRPDGSSTPLHIESALAWGANTILDANAVIDAAHAPHHIALQRDLGALFDAIDFDTAPTDAQARSVLRALVGSVRVVQHQ